MKTDWEIIGLDEIEKMVKELGEIPGKCVTGAAKAGAKLALQHAKTHAPRDSGDLARGIVIIKGERKKPGKKVYQVGMDPRMNDIFVKISSTGKRYYYPASIEYGFLKKDGTRVEGKHFLRDSLTEQTGKLEEVALQKLGQLIDKELKKR